LRLGNEGEFRERINCVVSGVINEQEGRGRDELVARWNGGRQGGVRDLRGEEDPAERGRRGVNLAIWG